MSDPRIRFSIITVCFNAERSIAAAIDSVAAQDYSDLEHLIIDGASQDATLGIVEANTHDRLRVLSEPDRGIYDAMNKGATHADGDVLLFLNADDLLADTCVLSDVAKLFVERPDLQLAYGDVAHISDGGEVVSLPQPRQLTRQVLAITTVCHQGLFARREVFQKVGAFKEEFPVVSDWDWLYRAAMIEQLPTGRLDRTLAVIGMDGVSHTVDFEKEKRTALSQYYSAAEIFRYRVAPLRWRRTKSTIKGLLGRR